MRMATYNFYIMSNFIVNQIPTKLQLYRQMQEWLHVSCTSRHKSCSMDLHMSWIKGTCSCYVHGFDSILQWRFGRKYHNQLCHVNRKCEVHLIYLAPILFLSYRRRCNFWLSGISCCSCNLQLLQLQPPLAAAAVISCYSCSHELHLPLHGCICNN